MVPQRYLNQGENPGVHAGRESDMSIN